jgi:hypothetical protein
MAGTVHVVVFSNFEGFAQTAGEAQKAVQWFAACSQAHPQVKWTHLYTPRYLLVYQAAGGVFTPFLSTAQQSGAEVGLHIHLYDDLVQALGVDFNATPNAEALSCDTESDHGYGVLLTGYSPPERATIVDGSVAAFLSAGLARPTTFCAGFSAADPALQAMLASKGFTASFAAQPVSPSAPPPGQYPPCWHQALAWSGHVTPLTVPYRVNLQSILSPPHASPEYLDLVEVPLNMWVDVYDLYLDESIVSRNDMFDCHRRWAAETGKETAVAIGVHAEIVAGEVWGSGVVSQLVDAFLKHVAVSAAGGGTQIVYSTASEVATAFWENKTVSQVACGPGRYAAIWEQREGPPLQARHGIAAGIYQQVFDLFTSQGYRLKDLNGFTATGQDRYSVVGEQSAGPPMQVHHGLSAAQYQQTFDALVAQGYRLTCVSGYGGAGQDRYAAIWEQRDGPPWQARHGLNAAQYQQVFDQLAAEGYRLVHVSGYDVGAGDRYAAIWEQREGPPWHARHGLNAGQYQQVFDQLVAQGYRLLRVCGHGSAGNARFAAIWELSQGPPWEARHGLTAAQYQFAFDELAARGYRPVCVSGYDSSG